MTGMNRCCYCKKKVGSPHMVDCVTVTKRVRYRVIFEGKVVGSLVWSDPHSWDQYSMEFHKNDGSWCPDNAIDLIEWADKAAEAKANIFIDEYYEGPCSCCLLKFEFDCVEDEGPFVEILDEEERGRHFGGVDFGSFVMSEDVP